MGIIIVVLIMISCTNEDVDVLKIDNVLVYDNSNSLKKFELLNLKKIMSINMYLNKASTTEQYFEPHYVYVSADERIYILDKIKCNIHVFDIEGKYLNTFGKKGFGPGEFYDPTFILSDSSMIIVSDTSTKLLHFFDYNGDFRFSKSIRYQLRYPRKLSNGNYIGFIRNNISENDKFYWKISLVLLDYDFNIIKILTEKKIDRENKQNKLNEYYDEYTLSEDEIFVAASSTTRYMVNVFDYNGNEKYRIRNKYRVHKFSPAELESFNEDTKKIYSRYNWEYDEISYIYKKSINRLYYVDDKLLVATSIDRETVDAYQLIVDVYCKGIYKKSFNIRSIRMPDYFNMNQIYFINNKIVYFNNLTPCIDIFKSDTLIEVIN